MEKVFITGGSGYIGSSLLNFLKNKNYYIYSLSRKKIFYNKKKINNVKCINGNLNSNLNSYLKKTKILIHMVTQFNNEQSNNYKECFKTNVIESMNFLEKARLQGVKKFLIAGTCWEYGNYKKKISVNDQLNPSSPYAISKAIFSCLITNWSIQNNLDLTYARIFQVYGGNEKKNRLYPKIIYCAQNNKDLKIISSNQKKDFIYINEVVDLLYNNLLSLKKTKITNVCKGKSSTVKEFAKTTWSKFSTKKSKLTFLNKNMNKINSCIGKKETKTVKNHNYYFNIKL